MSILNITLDEHEFWNSSPAASEIFKYLDKILETDGGAWGFDKGSIGSDLKTSYALFSCTALNGWGKDKLTISATLQPTGVWKLTHKLQRAT